MSPLLEARGVVKCFPLRAGRRRSAAAGGNGGGGLGSGRDGEVRAVDGVDLHVDAGECVALVGESGSGKTTLGRCLVRLVEPDAGEIRFRGEDLMTLSRRELRARRQGFQMVFQDPYDSLSPRTRIGDALAEPLAVHGLVAKAHRPARVAELLDTVGLGPEVATRFPHALSGGQRQRVGIARALACEPALLVADEPVSALDVSVRAQVLDLLRDLQHRLDLGVLLIAHDLALVRQVAQRVLVMHQGRVVEEGATEELFAHPRHPYTMELLAAVPRLP